MSGEALNRTQLSESAQTVIDDCVRAVKRGLPWRQAWQLGQLQFHCGNPPPAAEPRTWTFKLRIPGGSASVEAVLNTNQPAGFYPAGWPRLAVGDVPRDFKAKAHVAGSRFFPFHMKSPVQLVPQKCGERTGSFSAGTRASICHCARASIAGIWNCTS